MEKKHNFEAAFFGIFVQQPPVIDHQASTFHFIFSVSLTSIQSLGIYIYSIFIVFDK